MNPEHPQVGTIAVLLNPQWRIDERFVEVIAHLTDLAALAAYGSAALADND